MKARRRRRRRLVVEVTSKPPVEERHGIELGDVYEAKPGREERMHTKGPRKGTRTRSAFIGSVWITAKGSNEPVRLLAGEFRTIEGVEP